MSPKVFRELVETVQRNFSAIEHREWNGRRYGTSQSEMWREASQGVGPSDWSDIIRVIAQGGEYYSIDWSRGALPESDNGPTTYHSDKAHW